MPKPSSALSHWKPQALALQSDELSINVPLHVAFEEAVAIARFFDRYWKGKKDSKGRVIRLGLDTAEHEQRGFTVNTGAEILSLQHAGQEAHTAYLLSVEAVSRVNPLKRARQVLDAMIATLEWLFDGVDDEKETKLASLRAAHADDPESADALASELDDYAALAGTYRDEMAGRGGFDPKLIDEARALAAAIRARPSTAASLMAKARAALALRNRVVTLLLARMMLVRSAARFVFRNQPEIVREVASAYERRRRAVARRAAAEKDGAPAAPAAPKPA